MLIMLKKYWKNRSGFALAEILVSLALITFAVAVGVPVVSTLMGEFDGSMSKVMGNLNNMLNSGY